MWGWRGRIGFVVPGDFIYGPELYRLLPEGVAVLVSTLGIERLSPEDIERTFTLYLPAAKHLATQECDFIILGGAPILTYMGYDRSREMTRNITETTGVPAILDLETTFDALSFLSAKKIVMVSPFAAARNEERKRLCESLGFKVLNIKGLGFERRLEFSKQPPDSSYRLAKQAFLEAPEADAIWISCPEWPAVANIERLERDVGKPVVTCTTTRAWAALRAIHIKEPIKGYGRLLELL